MNGKGQFHLLYRDLRAKYGSRIPYTKLLRTYHWKGKRDQIVLRDANIAEK